MPTPLFTPEQYRDVQEYQRSCRFDDVALIDKYGDPYAEYPAGPKDATADVIIAGGGPAGLMYGLFLASKGFRIVLIEPYRAGHTTREWNISLGEIMRLRCILSEEEIHSCLSGRLVNPGCFSFLKYYTYRSEEVLDRFVDPERLLLLLRERILSAQHTSADDTFLRTSYDRFFLNDSHVCVTTTDGKLLEGTLFLHAMGSQDELHYYANRHRKKASYTVAGIRAHIGDTPLPKGDILRTISDADFGSEKQQIGWEMFISEEPATDLATIYVFSMAGERGDLPDLVDYLEKTVRSYIKTDVTSVKKPLYGYIDLPDDITGTIRSMFPRVYSIGENSIISVATGCGFAFCVKNLEYIGSRLVKALNKERRKPGSALSADRLNSILPDTRLLCSVAVEQLFKETLIRGEHETAEKPNLHSAAFFRLLSLVSDTAGRNDMLKSVMRPHLLLEALLKVRKETDYTLADFFEILRSNNGDIVERLQLIARSYRYLVVCEIREIFKHLWLVLRLRRGQVQKEIRHLGTLFKANPFRFYLVYRFLMKEARGKS